MAATPANITMRVLLFCAALATGSDNNDKAFSWDQDEVSLLQVTLGDVRYGVPHDSDFSSLLESSRVLPPGTDAMDEEAAIAQKLDSRLSELESLRQTPTGDTSSPTPSTTSSPTPSPSPSPTPSTTSSPTPSPSPSSTTQSPSPTPTPTPATTAATPTPTPATAGATPTPTPATAGATPTPTPAAATPTPTPATATASPTPAPPPPPPPPTAPWSPDAAKKVSPFAKAMHAHTYATHPRTAARPEKEHLETWVKIVASVLIGLVVIGLLMGGYRLSLHWSQHMIVSQSQDTFEQADQEEKWGRAREKAIEFFGWWPVEDRPNRSLFVKVPRIKEGPPQDHFKKKDKEKEEEKAQEKRRHCPECQNKNRDAPIADEHCELDPGVWGYHCQTCLTSWRTGYILVVKDGTKRLQLEESLSEAECCGRKLHFGVLKPNPTNHHYVAIMSGQLYENICDMDAGLKLSQRGNALFFMDLIAHTLIVVLIPLQGSFGKKNFIDILIKVIMIVLAVFGTVVKGLNQVYAPGEKGKDKLRSAAKEYSLIRELACLQGDFAPDGGKSQQVTLSVTNQGGTAAVKTTKDDGREVDDNCPECEDDEGTKFMAFRDFVNAFDLYMNKSQEEKAKAKKVFRTYKKKEDKAVTGGARAQAPKPGEPGEPGADHS